MNLKKVLLFLKQGEYDKIISSGKKRLLPKYQGYIKQIERAKYEHLQTIEKVKEVLKRLGIAYEVKSRNECFYEKEYELIITIGGDGTFIRASHYTYEVPILGVNSSPSASVGHFCIANQHNIEKILLDIKEDRWRIDYYNRIRIVKTNKELPIYALNDVLFSPSNPASTSKYIIILDGEEEIQKSSGVWISSFIGQTAGYKSAGGKKFTQKDAIAFVIREPYIAKEKYSLLNRIISKGKYLTLIPLSTNMAIYIDGDYISYTLKLGEELKFSISDKNLPVVSILPP
jgi:NAD+ kinase